MKLSASKWIFIKPGTTLATSPALAGSSCPELRNPDVDLSDPFQSLKFTLLFREDRNLRIVWIQNYVI
jgi:hypothetical protein